MIVLLWLATMIGYSFLWFLATGLVGMITLGRFPTMNLANAVVLGCMTGTMHTLFYFVYTNFKW